MGKDKKRDMPAILKTTLSMDAYLSHALVNLLEKSLPLKQLKVHYQVLEVSCHGIAWIASLLAFIWILNNRSMYQMQVNLLLGLVIDIIFVSLLKAITRRRRPAANNDPFCIGPDKYSFPSGHASRAAFVVYFFLNLSPLSLIFVPPLLAWSTSVCLSRLMMRRHHLLDIAAGVLLGIFEGILIGCMYLDVPTCAYLISWMTDEKIDGAEYDV
ncbi:hypothetical protein KM043_010739 [Ampulex compressa]|nr:hypothetical protein KM043_010739 [Ampulex compressa]